MNAETTTIASHSAVTLTWTARTTTIALLAQRANQVVLAGPNIAAASTSQVTKTVLARRPAMLMGVPTAVCFRGGGSGNDDNGYNCTGDMVAAEPVSMAKKLIQRG
jgi:hypothetical protein